jgi:hypothetical protein
LLIGLSKSVHVWYAFRVPVFSSIWFTGCQTYLGVPEFAFR